MKLYLAPGACSLADHIALHEAGMTFDRVRVDLKAGQTHDGSDYKRINPKGYVPALRLDDGEVLTENIAILSWVADQAPALAPKGPLARYRLLEMLAFISTEVHKAFKPFFAGGSEADKTKAAETIERRLSFLAEGMEHDYLFGEAFTVADAYLFVMEMWARKNGLSLPGRLAGHFERMNARAAVRQALEHEGLSQGAQAGG
ncbi:MAG TPA: glutathione binding-like protein [Caulobacteraceae bacterium]|jgi:glutathione S-transferase|nr:glutathione binding-like protein [Caulobacteraceae bacterium]